MSALAGGCEVYVYIVRRCFVNCKLSNGSLARRHDHVQAWWGWDAG